MADNNRGRDDRYQQSNNNWQEDPNRFEDENRNRSNSDYGSNIYGSEHQNQSVRGGWNNTQGDNRWRQQTGNQTSGGAYSSDYGYQGGGYDQNNSAAAVVIKTGRTAVTSRSNGEMRIGKGGTSLAIMAEKSGGE